MSRSKTKQTRQKAARSTSGAAAVDIRRLLPVLITVLFLAAIFLIPYHIPGPGPSDSQSWEFGFNNTAAQCLIALMLLALFAWQFLFGRATLDDDPVARALVRDDEPVPLRSLILTMGIFQVLSCAVLVGWYGLLPMSHYGEFTYCIQRVEAAILGRAPYVDFAFDYGPALLAMPVGIYHLFKGAVSVEAAYAASLVIHYIIGFVLVTYIISQINARGRVLILAMVGFQLINLTMGIQYTPIRFTIAIASIFALRHIHRVTEGFPLRRGALMAIGGFLLPLLNFSISPELGLALTISLCVYFLWFLFGPERRLALLVLSVLAGVAIAAFIFPRPYYNAMLSFGKGSGSFPIFPTVHILTFLAAAILVFPRLGIIALRDKSAAAPFCAGLAFLCGLFILPSTGRCDPGHIWSNSVGLFIIALAAVSWLETKWWYTLWGIYLVVFPLFNEVSFWDHYKAPIQNFISIRNQLANYAYDSDNYTHLQPGASPPPIHYSKLLPMGGELLDLPKIKIGLPLGDNETMERYLILNGRFIPVYHIPPYDDVFGDADLQREYQDLRAMQYIYVPMYYLNYLRPVNPQAQQRAQAEADSKFLSSLLLFPVDLPPVHPIFTPDAEIMRHIATEYGLVKQYQGGVLLKRKD